MASQSFHEEGKNESLTPRLKKPTVKDPRLVVGIILVATAVWLGSWVVEDAKSLKPVFVASKSFAPGQAITRDDLRIVEVNIGSQSSQYLTGTLQADERLVATQPITEGEFIPVASVADEDTSQSKVIAINIAERLPDIAQVGSTVDLWFTADTKTSGLSENTQETKPELVAENLYVSQLPDTQNSFNASATQTIHVVVPAEQINDVLGSRQKSGTLALLMSPGSMS
ncbi:SAF domain-containing protein [Timonella sp. A28]|uniref:SAF domain-containing protein n=1 Tax=Timonella sp. A28 TaxID=3442640 RepID=UPI003EBD72D2